MYEVIEDSRYIYLVMEVCEGGELFDFISLHKRLSERKAALLFKQLLLGLSYLHCHDICHRDLKPENLLFADSKHETIKLIDFGLSKILKGSSVMSTRVGTPYYISPDVLSGNYNKACDLWSAGVILYILLSGYPPFAGATDSATMQMVRNGVFSFSRPEWISVSLGAKDLISNLLVIDPADRYSVEQALHHPWIHQLDELSEVPLSIDIGSLRAFVGMLKLQKTVIMYIASQVEDSEIVRLKDTFLQLDTNQDGTLTLNELEEGLSGLPGISSDEIRGIMLALDADHSGSIDYTGNVYAEFVAGLLDRSVYLSEEKLWAAFKLFDRDNSNTITALELRSVLDRENIMASDPSFWQELIRQADTNGDGVIVFGEFVDMMSDRRLQRLASY
jgi:calcium-dependent protein kinase